MHKIQEKEFTLEDFSCEHLIDTVSIEYLEDTIKRLNWCRDNYLEDPRKDLWWQMIQLLPSSYNQTRNVMMNYEVLANIYKSRKNHKLDEWREFCNWIEGLPYSEIITVKDEEKLLEESIIDILRTHRYTDEECVEKISKLIGIRINKNGW